MYRLRNTEQQRIYNIKLDKKCQTCIMYNNGVLNPGLVHHIIVTDNINKSVVFSFFQENAASNSGDRIHVKSATATPNVDSSWRRS